MTSNLQLDQVTIGNALDALNRIPDASIDLVVTSPPYNKRSKTQGWLVNKVKYEDFDDRMPEEEYQQWQVKVLEELLRVTKPGGSVFYNHKLRWHDGYMIHPLAWLMKTQWHIKQEIVWDRGLAANMRGWRFWQVDERIYWLYRPINGYRIGTELKPKHAKLSSIWRMKPAPRNKEHPAAFPIGLPARIIYSVLETPCSVVLDPFCGTGTTLVAAKLLGHHYIGIDVSSRYVEYSQKRLEHAEHERSLVEEELAKHVIEDTFMARKKRGTVSWPFGPKSDTSNNNL